MKLFDKKEEKNKVGRPRLADEETKKKAIISVCVAFVLIITLALTGAFKLNIIKFNKLKGTVNVNLCSEIPVEFQPGGNYEYGFTDPKFYSAVVSTYNEDASYCNTIAEEQLKSITSLSADSTTVDNADGVQYLTGLKTLYLSGWNGSSNTGGDGNLTSIDLSRNTALTHLDLRSNNLNNIDLSNNKNLEDLLLSYNNLSSIDLSGYTYFRELHLDNNKLSGELDLSNIYFDSGSYFILLNNNKLTSVRFSDVNGIDGIEISNNELEELQFDNCTIFDLVLNNNKLTSFDTSGLVGVSYLNLGNNQLDGTLDLSKYDDLSTVVLNNNNITRINLSGTSNLQFLFLQNNPVINTMYILKDNLLKYNENIILNESLKLTYSIDDNNIAFYENGILKALKEGVTTIKMSNENIIGYKLEFLNKCLIDYDEAYCNNIPEEDVVLPYFLSQEIKVYDVTSKEYEVDNNSKTIDLKNKPLDIDKIVLTKGYIKEINDNVLRVKDGDVLVDTYTVVNVKEETPVETTKPATTTKETTTTKENSTITKKQTTKKASSKTTTKNKTKVAATTRHNLPEGNLIVYGNYIPNTMLEQIKGQDRNLTLINDDISILINGKDIEEVKDINIDYRLVKYEEDKNIKNAFILEFINKKELPKRFKITLKVTEEFKEVVGLQNIDIYDYSDNKLIMMEENIDVVGNEISFSTDKLDKCLLMKDNIKVKNKKLKKSKLNICLIIILLLLLLIIGYILYKKSNKKEGA